MKKQTILTIALVMAMISLSSTATWALPGSHLQQRVSKGIPSLSKPLRSPFERPRTLASAQGLENGKTLMLPPGFPSSFWGTVTVGGVNVPDGTLVEACINGVCYAQTTTFTWGGSSVYSIEVPSDNPDTPEIEGGVEGDVTVFKINGQVADQTGTWYSGTNIELNLTLSPDGPIADFNCTASGALTINCIDTSIPGIEPIDAWGWNFGDGGTSTDQNPIYTYLTTGTYTVTLAITDTNGLSDDVSKAIVVPPIGGPIIRVYPLTSTVGVGITTTVAIVIENVTGLYAFDVTVGYSAPITSTQLTLGPDWQGNFEVMNVIDNDNYQIRLAVSLLGDGSLSGDVVLATITFQGAQSGTVPLTLIQSGLWDRKSQEIPGDVQNGEIIGYIIVDAMLHTQGVCRLQTRTDHTGCTVEVDGASDTTDSLGQYQVSVLAGTCVITASMPGYLYASTSVSGAAAEIITLSEVELRAGDVNGDCIVNILDLAAIGGCYDELSSCNPNADFNDDGSITMPDLVAAAINYLRECPQPWDLIP